MNRNPESTKTQSDRAASAKPETAGETLANPFAALFQNSLERYARIRKETLDVVAQQSAETAEAFKQSLNVPPNTPGVAAIDLAVQGIERMIEADKRMLDVLVEQSSISMDSTKQHGSAASRQMNAATEMLQKTAERAVEVQKLALDMAAQQNKIVVDAVKQQPWVAAVAPGAAAAAETIQRGMEAAVEAQKEFLDSTSQPLKTKSAKG